MRLQGGKEISRSYWNDEVTKAAMESRDRCTLKDEGCKDKTEARHDSCVAVSYTHLDVYKRQVHVSGLISRVQVQLSIAHYFNRVQVQLSIAHYFNHIKHGKCRHSL